jgi:hypothetical protein
MKNKELRKVAWKKIASLAFIQIFLIGLGIYVDLLLTQASSSLEWFFLFYRPTYHVRKCSLVKGVWTLSYAMLLIAILALYDLYFIVHALRKPKV